MSEEYTRWCKACGCETSNVDVCEECGVSASACCVSCPHCGKAIDPPEQIYFVSFIGGAADRARLDLANIPMILRVVVDAFGNVDALDAEGDEPREGETVHLYKRNEKLGWIHYKESLHRSNLYGEESSFVTTADYYLQNAQSDAAERVDYP